MTGSVTPVARQEWRASINCKHRRILVLATYSLDQERAVCLECDADTPEWRSLPFAGRAFYYRYLGPEDFLNGVVPRITSVS